MSGIKEMLQFDLYSFSATKTVATLLLTGFLQQKPLQNFQNDFSATGLESICTGYQFLGITAFRFFLMLSG
jgi:hypothetical protein